MKAKNVALIGILSLSMFSACEGTLLSNSSSNPDSSSSPPVISTLPPVISTPNPIIPPDVSKYYFSIDFSQSGAKLKTSLFGLIDGHKSQGYGSNLNDLYRKTDVREDGTIWDIYSNVKWEFGKKICGNYKVEGDCWNKEHSVPQSWFNQREPMRSDLFHLYPTDGKVNGMRSNNPFGEVSSPKYTSGNGSKLGPNTFSGFNGTVFEPLDEYKGDLARSYFYMATRYETGVGSWGSGAGVVFSRDFPNMTPFAVNLFKKWNKNDPVSKKEIDRNNGIYSIQNNRNPFIDHPEFVGKIWGN